MLDKSQLSTDFTTKSTESTETQTHGNTALKCSITCQSEPSLMEKPSVFMVVSALKSRPLTRSEQLIERSKSHTKDLSVTWCGQILRTSKTGPSTQEALGGCLDLRSPMTSVTLTELIWLPELISWFRKGTFIGSRYDICDNLRTKTSWRFGVLLTIVTGAITWLQLWKSKRQVKKSLRFSKLCQSQWRVCISKTFCLISCDVNAYILFLFIKVYTLNAM